ncbi:hypothetical protein V494_01523 [Pseudogymnoascus sp. VKM F-4513 (FW-928)]|nr:hypothetical protein V494_01523 [Pseudogymnoascus sp. VKM F-4513 (FW-928)]
MSPSRSLNAYYLDRDQIFVDVNGARKGTCVQDQSDTLNCMAAIFFNRRAMSQLVCKWDEPETPPPPPPPPTKFKAMVVGDSISHGHEGDYTWRYRLSQWTGTQNLEMTYVGPYKGTFPKSTTSPPSPAPLKGHSSPAATTDLTHGSGYAAGMSSDWDTGHFAAWGRQAAQDKGQIQEMVATYQPDILLVELGFNDVGWFVSDADGTLRSMNELVGQARAAKPDIKFAIANIPHRTFIGGRQDLVDKTNQYNEMLGPAVAAWNQPSSPVGLVDLNGAYSCSPNDGCDAAYDGLHPNEFGEYEIASAFSRTLISVFGLGSSPLFWFGFIPERPTTTPTGFKVESLPLGIKVSWDAVYGAHGYDIREGWTGIGDWTESRSSSNAFYKNWVFDGNSLDYEVRTNNGNGLVSAWTAAQTVVAHPSTINGPPNIHTAGDANGISVWWDSAEGATSYQVIWWDMDCDGCYISAWSTAGNSMALDVELTPGHVYAIWVESWNSVGGGVPAAARRAIAGHSDAPGVPYLESVTVLDGTTARVEWTGVPYAAGYYVYTRNTLDGSVLKHGDPTYGTSHDIAFMFPGVWYFEFCVTGFNGDAESEWSNCIIPLKPLKLPFEIAPVAASAATGTFKCLVAPLLAGLPVALSAEAYPSLPTWKCTASGGCVEQNTSVVLDQVAPFAQGDPGSRTADDYAAMGVSTSGNAVTLYHYVNSGGTLNAASPRIYLIDENGEYVMMSLLDNQELSVDVDYSTLPCGENGAFYLSQMEADGGSSGGAGAGMGYCDAQCQGYCCAEMDILESNSMATAMTPHPCKGDNCDSGGCGFNPYASGQPDFYGVGKTVDTGKTFTVVTQFTASGGVLSQITRKYIQNGQQIDSGVISSCGSVDGTGGMPGMGESLGSGMVLAMSIWNDAAQNMGWLDAGGNGPCTDGEGSPSNIEAQHPDTHVIFSNIRWGDIGSTTSN